MSRSPLLALLLLFFLLLAPGCGLFAVVAGGKMREAEKAREDVCKIDPATAPLCSEDRDCNDDAMACSENLCVPWQCKD